MNSDTRAGDSVRTWFIILIVLLISAGCTRPVPSQTPPVPAAPTPPEPEPLVTAERTGDGKVLITFRGSADADRLLELETTVITGSGSVFIRSMGSRLDTTPVQIGATDTFPGPFPGTVRVMTTAYFTNGTPADVLDTRI